MFVLHQLIWFLFIYLLLFVESGLKYICTLKKVIYIYIYILCLNFTSPLKAPHFSFLFFLPFWHRHFGKHFEGDGVNLSSFLMWWRTTRAYCFIFIFFSSNVISKLYLVKEKLLQNRDDLKIRRKEIELDLARLMMSTKKVATSFATVKPVVGFAWC